MSDVSEKSEEDKAKELAGEGRWNTARQLNPNRRIYAVDSPAGVLILGVPPRGLYLAYRVQTQSDDAATKAGSIDALLTACAVDPVAVEYTNQGGLLHQCPGLCGNGDVYITLQKCAGVIKEDFAKK